MYYQPDNAVLIVAGNIDETKTLELDCAGVRKNSEAEANAAGDFGRSSRRTTASVLSRFGARAKFNW